MRLIPGWTFKHCNKLYNKNKKTYTDIVPSFQNYFCSIQDMASHSMCRIVLMGKTGVGKSSTGNTILGEEDRFTTGLSSSPVTKQCQAHSAVISGKIRTVVDTPDFLYSEHDDVEMFSPPGIHVFLYVLKLSTFTEQEAEIVAQFEHRYGEEAFPFTIILFTHGDWIELVEMEPLISQNERLQNLVNRCGGRFHVLNNHNPADRQQVYLLLEKIDRMVSANGNNCYTLEMMHEAKGSAEEQAERILEEQHREEERARMKHQRDLEMARRETEIRVRKKMEDRMEMYRAEIVTKKEAVKKMEKDPEHKGKAHSVFQLKYVSIIVFFSLVMGITKRNDPSDNYVFGNGYVLGGSAVIIGMITGKVLVRTWKSPFKTSCSSPQSSSGVLHLSMKKMFVLLCGAAGGLALGYMNSKKTAVTLLAGLAGVSGALSATYKSY